MSPKDKVRALLHKRAGAGVDRKEAVRACLHKHAASAYPLARRGVQTAAEVVDDAVPAVYRGWRRLAGDAPDYIDVTAETVKNVPWWKRMNVGGMSDLGRFGRKNWKALLTSGTTAATLAAYNRHLGKEMQEPVNYGAPTPEEKEAAGIKPREPGMLDKVPTEALAAAGGAAVGAPAGYALAPKLGLDRITGTIGTSALAAIVAALAANKLKKK